MSRGRLWTDDEKAKLTELWNAEASETAIMKTLERTWGACRTQVKILRLPNRNRRAACGILRRNAEMGKP